MLFSGLLPGHRLRARHVIGALLGFAAAAILVWDKLGAGTAPTPARASGFALALRLRARVVELFRRLAPAGRRAEREPSPRPASPPPLLAVRLQPGRSSNGRRRPAASSWVALVGLGLGPIGAAFLLWDIGMKQGNVPLLGVLSYAALILSTALLVALGLAQATWSLAVACALMVVAAVIATRAA